ncbi:MAG TPA: NlpC/P60 family protein [Candidatus Saccharimonadales bacterium]|nr:NlpC/P60 family protein [Candidatus Saccharimonadales bacterium]
MRKAWLVLVIALAPVILTGGCFLVMPILAMGGKAQRDAQAQACTANDSVSLAPAPAQINAAGATINGHPLTSEQISDASVIVGVARARSLTQRDALVGLMVALQETTLRNLPYGDRDSLGLFQQRPSQGWGTPEEIMSPAYAANKFFDRLAALPNRNDMSLIDEAMKVQRPNAADYERTFNSWQPLASQLLGTSYEPLDSATTAQEVGYDSACPAGGASSSQLEAFVQAALGQVGKPYVWGGQSPFKGFDCSGLVLWALAQAGIDYPDMTAADEYNLGPHVPADQLQRGDLVFWANDTSDPSTIHHVAIYLGNNQIIAAPHTGALVGIQPMYWAGYIGATRLATISSATPSNQAPTQSWQLPVVSSSYTTDSINKGVDFVAAAGTPVYAVGDGTISTVGSTLQLGNYIAIKHDGDTFTEYAHLQRYASGIQAGMQVKGGQVIGYVGSTGAGIGNRLLFVVTVDLLPTDPVQFLRQHGLRP